MPALAREAKGGRTVCKLLPEVFGLWIKGSGLRFSYWGGPELGYCMFSQFTTSSLRFGPYTGASASTKMPRAAI